MSEMITAELVDLDLSASTKEAAARSLAERMVALGRVTDLDGFLADVAAREAQMPTGLDGGIGIPHCRSAHVTEPTLAFGRSAAGVDFGAADGPADLIFLIAAPAAALIRGDEPPAAGTEDSAAVSAAASAEAAAGPDTDTDPDTETADDDGGRPFRIVAVTSCPTGIAHTYMAAESLENAGREAGVELVVETQGSAGFTRLDPALIADADGVIFAHDVPVREKERFAGKPTVDVGVKAGINKPAQLIADVRGKAERGEVTASAQSGGGTPVERAGDSGDSYGTKLRKWLMTGVSYMVPFVAAGGLLIALGFAIGGWQVNKAPSVMDHFVWTQADSWGALLFQIGGVAFGFLVPVLAGYIAYGMADRPGLVP